MLVTMPVTMPHEDRDKTRTKPFAPFGGKASFEAEQIPRYGDIPLLVIVKYN